MEFSAAIVPGYGLVACKNSVLLSTYVLGIAQVPAERKVYPVWYYHSVVVCFRMVPQLLFQGLFFHSDAGIPGIRVDR